MGTRIAKRDREIGVDHRRFCGAPPHLVIVAVPPHRGLLRGTEGVRGGQDTIITSI